MKFARIALAPLLGLGLVMMATAPVDAAKAPKPVVQVPTCSYVSGWWTWYSGYLGSPTPVDLFGPYPDDVLDQFRLSDCSAPWDSALVILNHGMVVSSPADYSGASIVVSAYVGETYPNTTVVVTSSSQLVTVLKPNVKKNKCAPDLEQWTLSGKIVTAGGPVMAGSPGGSLVGKVGGSVKFSWCVLPYDSVSLLGSSVKL